jgi:magnesium transporter
MTRSRLPRRLWRIRRPPPGSAPGTIIAPPKGGPRPSLHLMAYGPDKILEQSPETVDQMGRAPRGTRVTWLDVQGLGDVEVIRALGARFGLHPLAIADIIHVEQRPKVETYDAHLFIVVRMPHLGERVSTEQVSLIVGKDFVVTFQERPGDCFDLVRQRLALAASRLRQNGADYLGYALTDAIVDSYFPVLEHFGEQIERLEHDVLNQPDPTTITRIHDVKRDLLELRRAIWPQRELVNALLREDTPFFQPSTRLYLRDCADHAFQLMDVVEIHREIASGLVDLYLSSLSARMNEIMKVLTIIATIFIPLGFIAGVYGMNFDTSISPFNMPELHWRFGYPIVLGAMAALALGMLGYFWRRGWLGEPRKRGARQRS